MSSHIQKSCVVRTQGLEATLSDSKKKYGDKVNALLSAWEHVTNFIPGATPEDTQSLIEWAHKHTLKLVLRGEWPKLAPVTKTHLSVTLQRCASHLVQHPAAPRCTALIALVHNPWSNPMLDLVLHNTPGADLVEEEFCCSEEGELLAMRLAMLCESRCEDLAINLATACVRSLNRSDRFRSVSTTHDINYMIDVYIVLIYKLGQTRDILAQLKLMDISDGLELVQRLRSERPTNETAPIWRISTKAAGLVAQYLVVLAMVRPISETGINMFEQIINTWAVLHTKLLKKTLRITEMIRKCLEPAESAQHIYIFCTALVKHFNDDSLKPLVIELYIKALTTDMNELESQKTKSESEKARETAKRLSTQFLKLADVVRNNIGIARECVLTAFSLHPTRACHDRIKEIAIACGKVKEDGMSGDNDVVNDKVKHDPCTAFIKTEKDTEEENDETKITNAESPSSMCNTSLLPQPVSSLSDSPTKNSVDFQNGQVNKSLEQSDQLLKGLLTPKKEEETISPCDKCPLNLKRESLSNGSAKELCVNCDQFVGSDESKSRSSEPKDSKNVERTLDALILIKGETITGSANYDEKSVPSQILDAEKLGLSPQLCDDLAVVLSSPRYQMLSWVLDWKELNSLCERYLEKSEEMRNTNKELKYLNIDYSQFKDWPSEDDTKDMFFGIEKGYEQWADVPSDNSEQYGSFQPAGGYKRSSARRSLDDTTTTDSESENVLRIRRTGRQRKIHRLESSESDYDNTERKPKPFRNRVSSISDTDSNTQDSQTDNFGNDSCRLKVKKKPRKIPDKGANRKHLKASDLTVDSVSHFHMLVNENVRHTNANEDASGSDVSSNDIITLFSADMDESKRETIKGSAYAASAPLIITERRSDPAVLKSLRMFRPKNAKKQSRLTQIFQKNLMNKIDKSKNKDNNLEKNSNSVTKFAPMLSTLNLNPKIVLTRADDVAGNLIRSKKQQRFRTGDITSELMNIQKNMSFPPTKNTLSTYQKQKGNRAAITDKTDLTCTNGRNLNSKPNLGKRKFDILAQAVRDSEILAKNVPGLNSLDMMVPPRMRPTVNVVQLSRNITHSPNSGTINSGNTPPRPNRTPSVAGNIQLPGTPSSGGHDSGVGMSPAGQTPPPRSSTLPDVGEETNQPPDGSPSSSTNVSTQLEPELSPRAGAIRRTQQSPKKSPSPCSVATTTTATANSGIASTTIASEQLHIVCKPDGSYQLASVNPNMVSGQRNILNLQNIDDGNVGNFSRQNQRAENATSSANRLTFTKATSQSGQNTGLPKFQQAFGKTIYTLSTDTSTSGVAVTSSETVQSVSTQKTTNLSKAVQTSARNAQQTNLSTGINVQSIANIPNALQLSTSRQILNIVQSSGNNSTNVATTSPNSNQTLSQLVQSVQSASQGVLYTHKIPVTISTTNPSHLNIIPTISHANSIPSGRTPVVKLNIIRAPLRQQNITGAIQAVLTTPRLQQQQQQQQQQPAPLQQQQQAIVRSESLLGPPIEVTTQVSSSTLEQLREFESVLEQVKERSTIQPQSHQTISTTATTTVQTQTTTQQTQATKQQQVAVSALAQQLLMPTQQSANNDFTSNGNNFQQDVFSQKVSLAYVNQNASSVGTKTPNSTPVVVVTSYCQPAASPALSVTSQSSSSPCVTPAPAPIPSTGKTPSTPPSSKTVKKTAPKTVKTSATNTTKAPPIPKPQQKPQEDEQTTQRIYAILDEYAEQLRNSPDLKNKPAPRRRSNPPTNPSQSSKRKKSTANKTKPVGQQNSELSPSTDDLGRTMGSEDSSSGVAHVQDSPAGFSASEEPTSNVGNVTDSSAEVRNMTSDSNDGVELNVKRRNLIFAEPGSGQPRAVIVQDAVQTSSVSVSEALASVTGKMGNTAVLVPGTNYLLPMNFIKAGQQYTIVSGGSKLLATVPAAVRTTGNPNVPNAFVLQSLLNQAGKIISQPTQMKQVKIPTLQTLSGNQTVTSTQNVQGSSVIIPQTANSGQFTGDALTEKSNIIGDLIKQEPGVPVESTASAIVLNKSNSAIGLIQRNLNESTENQQLCGVITSNPNLNLQSARLYNSSIHKATTPGHKSDNMVCLTPTATITHTSEKKSTQESSGLNDKSVSIQSGAAIALAFGSQSDVSMLHDAPQQQQQQTQTQKDTKDVSMEMIAGVKIISPKSVKKKLDDAMGISENVPKRVNTSGSVVCSSNATSVQSNDKIDSMSTITVASKQSGGIDNATQFLVTGGPSSSDSQESPVQQSTEGIDMSCKVGNGLLYGNARLQEAWEPEGKVSPDTPWRYVPTSTNSLNIEPLNSRYSDNTDNASSVLQVINKGQGIEMTGGQIYQTNAKKYFINHTLEPFQQYSTKSNVMKSPLNPRLDRELMQQKLERKAAIEREMKLQKSLSEECEDLGVDEPSTSDLFPEADLLFDTNHSPSYDHSSQDASCSQPLGMKPYTGSYFRSLDSSSGSRDTSPITDFKLHERRRSSNQRARSTKESLRKLKRGKVDDLLLDHPKHIRLTLDNVSQDEASNSNSDISRLSPTNLVSLENDSLKESGRAKIISRNGSKEGSPSSVSSIPSNIKLDIDMDSESLPPGMNVNNASTTSSGDESLTLLTGNTADVTIPSPLSPIAGPMLSTHKYTYTNKKRITSKVTRMDYLSWESPMSERTRSSSDEEDSSVSESVSSQPEENALSNGLEDTVQSLKSLTSERHCGYLKKNDKLQVNARVVLNRSDHKANLSKRIKLNESIQESVMVSSDKTSELSDEETGNIALVEPDCRARRSSLRGHVKKGCACCNGSPERPKKKSVKADHSRLKKRLSSKQIGKKR